MTYNLNYEGFEDHLLERRKLYDGVQYLFKFDNSYGASVVKNYGSYGYSDDLWELAVIEFDRYGDFDLTYDTEITCDVEGYLTDDRVRSLLERIKEL